MVFLWKYRFSLNPNPVFSIIIFHISAIHPNVWWYECLIIKISLHVVLHIWSSQDILNPSFRSTFDFWSQYILFGICHQSHYQTTNYFDVIICLYRLWWASPMHRQNCKRFFNPGGPLRRWEQNILQILRARKKIPKYTRSLMRTRNMACVLSWHQFWIFVRGATYNNVFMLYAFGRNVWRWNQLMSWSLPNCHFSWVLRRLGREPFTFPSYFDKLYIILHFIFPT